MTAILFGYIPYSNDIECLGLKPKKRGSMKLSTRSRYGTRILVDLARHNDQGPVQIGEISKRQDISVKYLEQLIRPLKQADLVTASEVPKVATCWQKNRKRSAWAKSSGCLKDKVTWLNVSVVPRNAPCPMTAR